MNCETLISKIPAVAMGDVTEDERNTVMSHVDTCPDCRTALRGSEALAELRQRGADGPSADLFRRGVAAATVNSGHGTGNQRFWLGTAFVGAVAASVFALVFIFGWTDSGQEPAATNAKFVVAMSEIREMNLAFETDRPLDGAQISILLSGNVEIPGYGLQRELTWSENLEAGVNRLTLPVIASGLGGGQMVVRMSHPLSEQVFIIDLPTES